MTGRHVTIAGAVLLALAAGCRDGGDDGIDPGAFAGDWDISLVVGAVDADPAADPASFPGDATFREHWVIDACDHDGCTLHRPDGGLLLGDLDGIRLEVSAGALQGDEERFVGEGPAAAVPRPEHPEVPEEGEEPGHAEAEEAASTEAACVGSPAQRWTVRIEVGVRDRVLSGTAFRTPEAMRADVEGTTCFGLDLTLGFSGVPHVGGAEQGQG